MIRLVGGSTSLTHYTQDLNWPAGTGFVGDTIINHNLGKRPVEVYIEFGGDGGNWLASNRYATASNNTSGFLAHTATTTQITLAFYTAPVGNFNAAQEVRVHIYA